MLRESRPVAVPGTAKWSWKALYGLHRLDRALATRKDHIQRSPDTHQLALELELLAHPPAEATEEAVDEWRESKSRRIDFWISEEQ